MKRTKGRLEQRWRRSGTNADFLLFKNARNLYSVNLRNSKTFYFSNIFLDCGSDQRRIYKTINNLINGQSSNIYPSSDSNQHLPDSFSTFFESKINNIVSSINDIVTTESIADTTVYSSYEGAPVLQSFNPLTSLDVECLIKKSPNKFCILDPIPVALLKDVLGVLIDPITLIINRSLMKGQFPTAWKHAIVSPILKKSSLEPLHRNYRPISNIPFLSKIIEKAALSQYNPHLNSFSSFSAHNSAYKPLHSTETLSTTVHSDIVNSIDNKKINFLVLLDLSAAFDSVNQVKLLHIFQHKFNVQGIALSWMTSYLLERSQAVLVNDATSKNSPLLHGVPQGSCVGPIAFLVYINAMYDIILSHNISVAAYADDTQLYLSCLPNYKAVQSALLRLERCISDVRHFMLSHQLKINDSKTEFMVIGTSKQLQKIDLNSIKLRVGQSFISPITNARNLGVIFDSNFSFKSQINNVSKNSYFQLTKIRQIKKYITKEIAESLTHALISSNIDYCNSLYYNLPLYQIKKLQRIQNSAARIITNSSRYSHVTPILKDLHWLPVNFRIKYKILLIAYKCVNIEICTKSTP